MKIEIEIVPKENWHKIGKPVYTNELKLGNS